MMFSSRFYSSSSITLIIYIFKETKLIEYNTVGGEDHAFLQRNQSIVRRKYTTIDKPRFDSIYVNGKSSSSWKTCVRFVRPFQTYNHDGIKPIAKPRVAVSKPQPPVYASTGSYAKKSSSSSRNCITNHTHFGEFIAHIDNLFHHFIFTQFAVRLF